MLPESRGAFFLCLSSAFPLPRFVLSLLCLSRAPHNDYSTPRRSRRSAYIYPRSDASSPSTPAEPSGGAIFWLRTRPPANLATWRCLNRAPTPRCCRSRLSLQANQRAAHPPFRRSKLPFFKPSTAGRTHEEWPRLLRLNNSVKGDARAPSSKAPQKTSSPVSKWTPKPMVRMNPDDYVIVPRPRSTVALSTAFQRGSATSRSKCSSLPEHTFQEGMQRYICPECGYATARSSSLKRHLRKHTGERPFRCSHCSQAFTRKHHLVTHLRIHTGEKPYQCNLCPWTFTHETSLQRHLISHRGEKPHKCHFCSKAFACREAMKRHERKYHPEESVVL